MPTDDEITSDDLSGPVIDRRTTMKLLSAAGMGGLAGCSTEVETTPTETATEETETEADTATEVQSDVKTGGRLQAGWFTGSIDVLDPPKIPVAIYFQVTSNIFSGLVTLRRDLTIRGDLATDWEVTNDGATITFQLRDDVKFHNGDDFTAEDVAYSIRRTINEELAAAPKLSLLLPPDDEGVVVEDDYTVTLNFEQAFAPVMIYLTRGPGRAATVVNKNAIEEMGPEQYQLTPVGTGPFKVTEHEVGDRITLDRFEDYFETDENGNQLPYLDGVDIKPIPEAATIVSAIESGDIDFAQEVPLQNVSRIEDANDVDKLSAPGVNWSGLSLNMTTDLFKSRKVRRAVAKGLDSEAYVKTAFFGNAVPDVGPIAKATNWVWRDDKPSDQDYAPEEAKQMLEEEGVADASFSILAQQGSLRASKTVRNQLNELGLNVEIDQVTSSTYWNRVFASDYDTTIVGSAGDPEPDQGLYNFFRKHSEDGVWNFTRYEDDEVHELLDKQRRQLDREERKQTLWDIEDQVIADAPWAFLVHTDDVAAKRSNVNGFVHIPFMRNFHRVWLEE
ncbi:ABC transporter substrate-binding protein [Halolamina sp.]|jgi:peptide/nickel transport system substrate-binding protein|uniref:ABC transporter substrate-binding protein n=1 Tax=Halolamina sp. TaxID=1940283 RepID=UPI000223B718|nr:ABC-type transporter, periplasmic subunit [halophilic archaeon DL31]